MGNGAENSIYTLNWDNLGELYTTPQAYISAHTHTQCAKTPLDMSAKIEKKWFTVIALKTGIYKYVHIQNNTKLF